MRPAPRTARSNDVMLLLVVVVAAWFAVIALARRMGAMPGTMGLGVGAFIALWLVMMAAMMLPSVAPFASFYTRTFTHHRQFRLVVFVTGYLFVWTLAALPAFGLARTADALVGNHRDLATLLAVALFLTCGIYQLSPMKDRCLALCRSPLGFVVRYGQSNDFVVGARHGAYCLGCCWTLMVLLVAFGLMNLVAMFAVAGVVLAEKEWARGVGFAKLVAIVCFALAIAVIVRPSIAGGLHQPSTTSMMGGM